MPASIVRSNTITLDLLCFDSNGDAVDPPDTRVSIVDPLGVTVVNLAVPTNVAVGHFQYGYPVSSTALLGAWAARWFGTIDGAPLETEEGFTVLSASSSGGPSSEGGVTCSPWATNEDAPQSFLQYDIDPVLVDAAFQVASDILYELTGRRWPGVCSDFIRPQAQWRAWEGPRLWWPNGFWPGSSWWGWCSCHRGRETGCTRMHEVKLPGHPVDPDSIIVKIDGVEHLPGDGLFRLDDHRFLTRIDGEGWPCCQDLRADDSEDRTWSIAYNYGTGPDLGGVRAAVLLGMVLLIDFNPDLAGICKVPSRATRITRAGTTIELATPADMVEKGLTGIRAVDLWVGSKILGRARRRATVLVPGRHRSARRPGV